MDMVKPETLVALHKKVVAVLNKGALAEKKPPALFLFECTELDGRGRLAEFPKWLLASVLSDDDSITAVMDSVENVLTDENPTRNVFASRFGFVPLAVAFLHKLKMEDGEQGMLRIVLRSKEYEFERLHKITALGTIEPAQQVVENAKSFDGGPIRVWPNAPLQ